jgi:Tol biopolymer transport system component
VINIKSLRTFVPLSPLIIIVFLSCCDDNGIGIPAPLPEYNAIDEYPAWSPRSEWIAHWHFNSDIRDTIYPTGLYIIDTIGTNRKRLIAGNAYVPDWSPDGNEIVFTNGNIFIIDIETKIIRELTF